LATPMSRWHLL